MKLKIIEFDTAVLAKEVGFDWKCFYYYDRTKNLKEPYLENYSSTDVEFRVDLKDLLENSNSFAYVYSAPEQALVQQWIYENFGYWVDVYRVSVKFRVGIECMNTGNSIWSNDLDYNNPEEALGVGLFQVLKIIKYGK
jgi:hypothetical protein